MKRNYEIRKTNKLNALIGRITGAERRIYSCPSCGTVLTTRYTICPCCGSDDRERN